MRNILYILILISSLVSCLHNHPKKDVALEAPPIDTVAMDTCGEPVIQEVVEWMNQGKFTPEEAAYWDSMANEGCLFIRGAERHLDTIINHMHIVFIPEL